MDWDREKILRDLLLFDGFSVCLILLNKVFSIHPKTWSPPFTGENPFMLNHWWIKCDHPWVFTG